MVNSRKELNYEEVWSYLRKLHQNNLSLKKKGLRITKRIKDESFPSDERVPD